MRRYVCGCRHRMPMRYASARAEARRRCMALRRAVAPYRSRCYAQYADDGAAMPLSRRCHRRVSDVLPFRQMPFFQHMMMLTYARVFVVFDAA